MIIKKEQGILLFFENSYLIVRGQAKGSVKGRFSR
jgi:hypothetical protein